MKQTFSHRKIINILFSQINLKAVSFFCLLIDINIFNQYALDKHSFDEVYLYQILKLRITLEKLYALGR